MLMMLGLEYSLRHDNIERLCLECSYYLLKSTLNTPCTRNFGFLVENSHVKIFKETKQNCVSNALNNTLFLSVLSDLIP